VAASLTSLLALPLVAKEYYVPGLAVFLLGQSVRFLAVTPGASLKVLDCVAYAGVPFGFALADSARALAASFLLFSFVAVASLPENRMRPPDALVCMAAFAAACFAPAWFGPIAYGLGVAGFAVTGVRWTRGPA
jgi:hypothetical protein